MTGAIRRLAGDEPLQSFAVLVLVVPCFAPDAKRAASIICKNGRIFSLPRPPLADLGKPAVEGGGEILFSPPNIHILVCFVLFFPAVP